MTKILKRSLALALALLMVLSGANLGAALNVLAAEGTVSKTVAQIVAANYDLSAAEKALLNSGYVASETVNYTVPGADDGLVSVDMENTTIMAKVYEDTYGNEWVPAGLTVEYNGTTWTKDDFNGEYKYSAEAATFGKAFSVKVTYELHIEVAADTQTELLAVGGYLKQGVANLVAVDAQSGNLYILEQAMPTLYDIATNGLYAFNQYIQMDNENAKQAIIDMYIQMGENGGQLLLSKMIAEYNAAPSKTQYLIENGAAMLAEINVLTEQIGHLNTWLNDTKSMINYTDEKTQTQVKMLYGVVDKIYAALETVNADPWFAANNPDIVTGANAGLDALVKALGGSTAVTPKTSLLVASTTVQYNMSMWNVNVKVVINAVNADNEVAEYDSKSVVITLADGATAADIEAAVKASGIDDPAKWDVYVADKFVKDADTLPETLTGDIDYVITYSPDSYTVKINDESAEYPYGYQLTLPKHADSTKAYDYDLDGNYYAQGSVITVEEDMTFTREEGAAYEEGNLYAIIAGNADNDKLTAILTSGAVKGNVPVNYRAPKDLDSLVKLEGTKLTAGTYAADYEGLNWVPYTYVVDGVEYKFNGATEVTIADPDFDVVQVYYRLELTNFSVSYVQDVFTLVNTLITEAQDQKVVLDALLAYNGTLGTLDKIKFGALNGVIDVAGGISDENKAFFKGVVSDIIANCIDSNGYLKIYNIIQAYGEGGLAYYYANSEMILEELNKLVGYLNLMLGDADKEEALAILMEQAGYGEYAEKITEAQTNLNTFNEKLKAPNAAIDVESDKLPDLAVALENGSVVDTALAVVPYIQEGPVTRNSDKSFAVTVKVTFNGKTVTSDAVTVKKGEALTADQVNGLKTWVSNTVKLDADLYNSDYNSAELDALVGKVLVDNVPLEYTWTAKEFTVKIDDEADQTVTVNNLTVKLPGHPNADAGMSYTYTINGVEKSAGTYTFTEAELKTLFVNGVYTITREEKNEATEKLVTMVNKLNDAIGYEAVTLDEKNGVYTGIVVNIGMGDLMNFVMGLIESGYSYIGLNEEGLMYLNDENALEVCIQTLINAVLNDEDFGTDSLIALGENGKGKLVSASLQLGNSAEEIQYEDLDFVINLTSVPEQMSTAAKYLKIAKPYVSFQSNEGVLDVTLNLPDQVYGAYLMVLMATGEIDMSNANAVDQEIAFRFLYDYLDTVLNSDMDLETFTNTMDKFGLDYDLTDYNDLYNKAVDIYDGGVDVTCDEEGMHVDMSFVGASVINGLIKLTGASVPDMYLGMIKEYKAGNIVASAKATLVNVGKTYNAIIVDAQAEGATNKYECTSSDKALAEETATLAGYSVVMLLSDVGTDLTISGTTILDLNGHSVNGTINATGKLIIIDSTKDTYNAGTVNAVTGNAIIIAGNYKSDVSAYLKDGYYMDGTAVRNSLYYVECDEDGNVSYVLNTNLISGGIPAYQALAVDIAGDFLLNYWTAAALSVDGNGVYAVDIDDVIALISSGSKADALITEGLGTIDVMGISDIINIILADLLDFDAITEALKNNQAVATYTVTTNPWDVEIVHVTEGNYVSLSLTNNADADYASTYTVSLVVEGKYAGALSAVTGELADIVEDETHITVSLQQPEYNPDTNEIDFTENKAEAIVSVNMSKNSDYLTMIGVILAYGNSAKREAVAEAINSGDEAALVDVINNTTVAEVFTALKVMSRNVDFKAMAKTVGVTVDVDSAADLEGIYHEILCAAGKGLEELEITGQNSKLGNLYDDESGYYVLTYKDIYREADISRRGYTAIFGAEATELTLKVKLVDDCLWGDADHENGVTPFDASLVLQYCVGKEIDGYFCTKRTDVSDGGEDITPFDASLILQYCVGKITEFPAEG